MRLGRDSAVTSTLLLEVLLELGREFTMDDLQIVAVGGTEQATELALLHAEVDEDVSWEILEATAAVGNEETLT